MSGIQQMLLSGGAGVALLDLTSVNEGALSRGVGYRVASDGKAYAGNWVDFSTTGSYTADAAYSLLNAWTNSVPSAYEIRCTVNSGTTPSGSATGSWLACSVTREWYITDTVVNGAAVVTDCTIEIRDAITTTVVSSCSFAVEAERQA